MLFPSISVAVIDNSCFTSVSEQSKFIRLLSNELKFLIMVSYTILQPRLQSILSEYHLMFKIRSPTRSACTYLHADTGTCTSFYSGSFAVEVTQNINYH